MKAIEMNIIVFDIRLSRPNKRLHRIADKNNHFLQYDFSGPHFPFRLTGPANFHYLYPEYIILLILPSWPECRNRKSE